jgi:hypothetical protein
VAFEASSGDGEVRSDASGHEPVRPGSLEQSGDRSTEARRGTTLAIGRCDWIGPRSRAQVRERIGK